MKQYLELVADVLQNGKRSENQVRKDRTGVGTYSVFGRQVRFNLEDGFPLLTTKKLHVRSIIHELLWFLRGDTNLTYLHENKVTIWDEWADPNGDLGPIYGKQWRAWEGPDGKVDQIVRALNLLKSDPTSRRILVVAYNPGQLPKTAPPACHTLFQLYCEDGRLSLQLYQRSADLMLGVPFNIASYSLLLMMIAQVSGLRPFEFIHTFGDLHIYANHLKGAEDQLTRSPKRMPQMELNPAVHDLFSFKFDDFHLTGYEPWPHIKFEIAV